jgi:acetyltransferase-like isoleucine patch superfamily enzyme
VSEGTTLPHDWFPRPLPANVEVGARSWLFSAHAFVHCRSRRPCAVRIGEDSGVYKGTHFELGPDGEVEIGRWCTIVGAIIRTNGRVSIGDFSFIAHEVVIADTDVARPPDGSPEGPATAIEIGENAWIGARAILLAGARVGADAIVGAGAVVDREVPPGSTVTGNPARIAVGGRSRSDD